MVVMVVVVVVPPPPTPPWSDNTGWCKKYSVRFFLRLLSLLLEVQGGAENTGNGVFFPLFFMFLLLEVQIGAENMGNAVFFFIFGVLIVDRTEWCRKYMEKQFFYRFKLLNLQGGSKSKVTQLLLSLLFVGKYSVLQMFFFTILTLQGAEKNS